MALLGTEQLRSSRVTDADGRAVNIDAGGIADTQNLVGTAAAPGSAATVVSMTGLTASGIYRVELVIILSGSAEVLPVNLRLRTNGGNIAGGGILPSLPGITTLNFPRVTVGADGKLEVITAAAATAGSVYTLRIGATRVE